MGEQWGRVAQTAVAMIRASATDLDFSRFGIVAIRVMHGTKIMQEWKRAS